MEKVLLEGSARTDTAEISPAMPNVKSILRQTDSRMDVMILFRKASFIAERKGALKKSLLGEKDLKANRQAEATNDAGIEAIHKATLDFAAAYDLQVTGWSEEKRRATLSGTVASMEKAFEITLNQYEGEQNIMHYAHAGAISVHSDLAPHIAAVLGLDTRPIIRRTRMTDKATGKLIQADDQEQPPTASPGVASPATASPGPSWSPSSVTVTGMMQLYDFPSGLDGKGQVIGIIELGGGYTQADLSSFFSQNKLTMPSITDVSVANATNSPGTTYDVEVTMDIEIAGAAAPGARLAVYFTANSTMGFIQAVQDAVNDVVNKPSVLSISWGMIESSWTPNELTAFAEVLEDAVKAGITVLASSGDQGYRNTYSFNNVGNVNYPASDPHVLACGGTMLQVQNSQIQDEVVWFQGPFESTGGGISSVFPVPDWQANAKVPASINTGNKPGRGVPDIAANAVNYDLYIKGTAMEGSGTSAVVPLMAGLIACYNQKLGKRVGYLNPIVYNLAINEQKKVFFSVCSGGNGGYNAAVPWCACTGLGRPYAAILLTELESIAP